MVSGHCSVWNVFAQILRRGTYKDIVSSNLLNRGVQNAESAGNGYWNIAGFLGHEACPRGMKEWRPSFSVSWMELKVGSSWLHVRGHQTTRNSYLSNMNLCNPNWPFSNDPLTYRAEDSVIPTPNTSGRLLVRLHLLPLAFYQLNRSALGGWWVRPSNWATNTAVVAMGILTITYGVWNVSSKYEVCVRVTSNFLFLPTPADHNRCGLLYIYKLFVFISH